MSYLIIILVIVIFTAYIIRRSSASDRHRLEKLEEEVRIQREEIARIRRQLAKLHGPDSAPEQSLENAEQAASPPEGITPPASAEVQAPHRIHKAPESMATRATSAASTAKRTISPWSEISASDDTVQGETAAPEHASQQSPRETAPDFEQPLRGASQNGKADDWYGWDIRRLEKKFGVYWTVWAGALALALGAIFLSAYAVTRITFTPAMRIGAGLVFSLALLAVGEYLRRNDARFHLDQGKSAYIPGGLTAAGICGLYGAIYAGHAVYGFFDAALTFLLLAASSLGALALALMHGPLLAALGLVGAYAAPILVGSSAPDPWVLTVYLLLISAAVLTLARRRAWERIEYAAAAAITLWGLIWLDGWTDSARLPFSAFLLGHAGLFLWPGNHVTTPDAGSIARNAVRDTNTRFFPAEHVLQLELTGTLAGLAGMALLSLLMLVVGHRDPVSLLTADAVFTLMVGASILRDDLRLALPIAAIAMLLSVVFWNGVSGFESIVRHLLNAPEETFRPVPDTIRFVLFAVFMAPVFAAGGLIGALRRKGDILFAAVSALTPLALYVSLWSTPELAGHRMAFFAAALIGAGAAAAASLVCDSRLKTREGTLCGGIYAAAGVAFAALALAAVLRDGWLTVALSLMVPALAWIGVRRGMPVLRWLTAAIIGLVGLRLLIDPLFLAMNVGTTPFFNWLLVGYGAPAAAFALAARIMRQERQDIFSDLAEAAAVVLGAVFASLELHHYLNNGNLLATDFSTSEKALHSLVWLGMAAAYQYIAARNERQVPKLAALFFGYAGLAMVLIGHVFLFNPLLTNDFIGEGLFFNQLLLLHALPALFLYILGRLALARREEPMATIATGGAAVLSFLWVSELVRVLFHPGGHIGLRLGVYQSELYTYSLVWLVCAVGLLVAAYVLKKSLPRMAGMALVILTAGKVFLIDMAGLQGILRALSFIGLGVVLLGIGWAYQRIFAQDQDTQDENGGKMP